MADVSEKPAREVSEAEAEMNKGAHLFRVFILDVEDQDNPVVRALFKRGDEYTDVQKRTRAILNGEGKEGDLIYEDAETSAPFEVANVDWHLALTRKQKNGGKTAGIDKEWMRILMADTTKSDAEKMAEIAKYL